MVGGSAGACVKGEPAAFGLATNARLMRSSALSASALAGFGAPAGGMLPDRSWYAMFSQASARAASELASASSACMSRLPDGRVVLWQPWQFVWRNGPTACERAVAEFVVCAWRAALPRIVIVAKRRGRVITQ